MCLLPQPLCIFYLKHTFNPFSQSMTPFSTINDSCGLGGDSLRKHSGIYIETADWQQSVWYFSAKMLNNHQKAVQGQLVDPHGLPFDLQIAHLLIKENDLVKLF